MIYETMYDASTKFWIPWFLILAIIVTAIMALYLWIGINGVRHNNEHMNNAVFPAVLLVIAVYALVSVANYGGSDAGYYVKEYKSGNYTVIEGEITDFYYSTSRSHLYIGEERLNYTYIATFTFKNPLPEEGYIRAYCVSDHYDDDADNIVRVDILVDD